MEAKRNPPQRPNLELRCPACRERMREFKQHALGKNVKIEGTCRRCRTRIFAIRRAPGWSKEGHYKAEKRELDYVDQAA